MLFSLPTSWENDLTDKIDALNPSGTLGNRVIELYGSLPYSLTGGGRAGAYLPQIGKEELESHIRYARSKGIEFNYLMNSPDFGGKEQDKDWLRELREYLAYLVQEGINRLTIANDFLIQLVCREFPELGVNVSVIAGVDTPDRAEQYEQMGVECIALNQHTTNRNFNTLTAIRKRVNCKLELIANTGCLDRCSRRDKHYKANRALSQLGVSEQECKKAQKMAEACTKWCTARLLLNPIELLKVPFIRPENIPDYEAIGIDILKIEGRRKKSDWIAQVTKFYLSQCCDGDILQLVLPSLGKNISSLLGNAEPTVLPLKLDNRKLGECSFLENLKQVTGKAREDYYAAVLRDALIGHDHPDVLAMQKQCRNMQI